MDKRHRLDGKGKGIEEKNIRIGEKTPQQNLPLIT